MNMTKRLKLWLKSKLNPRRARLWLLRKIDPEGENAVVAITALMGTPHWEQFEGFIASRRESWIADTRTPVVYQNHAELVNTNARVAECDWLLEIFDDCRSRINGEPVGQQQ